MGEIKSVKVDNWGVFFLQKLQNFFNKTDYCDLTLQFRDNSQLKVHRLVLSACTDYFNVLEQTCDIVDDALIMPNELQADVVVPIVNFMYTGTLEFELKMYGKLLRTAKEMNMTVLLKLLEAHRRTMEGVSRAQRPPSPKGIRRRGPYTNNSATTTTQYQQTNAPAQRRTITQSTAQTPQHLQQQQQQRRIVQVNRNTGQHPTTSPQYRQQMGGVSIVKTSSSPIRAQYGNTIVYETQKEIKQEHMEYESHIQEPASPFEQLRKGYNNNKRPPTTSFVSPPAKKPNLEDVKEFAEQQRMRKQIAAEYGEDQEAYDNLLDDDVHNDDDDDEIGTNFAAPSTSKQQQQQQQQHQSHAEEGTTTITFKHESGDKPPTIVVKDSSNSKMNHAKIIQEVLRQYPHLVKSNKNIKLKILPSTGDRAQRIVIKKEDDEPITQQEQPTTRQQATTTAVQHKAQSANVSAQSRHISSQVGPNTTVIKATPTVNTPIAQPQQKRRIDSKTMHALIALGAGNTTGPWLCLRCGVDGRPISIPSYRGFRRHLINTHKEHIDAALCEHCGWRSQNDRSLHFHIQIEHKIKSQSYTFEECTLCAEQFEDPIALQDHMLNIHPDDNKQQCIYCNKIFAKEMELYNHMKSLHKVQALEDGIIDETDEEFLGSQDEEDSQDMNRQQTNDAEKKVQILSDITLPVGGCTYLKQDINQPNLSSMHSTEIAESEHETIGITTDGSGGTKFVAADGSEVILTEEQKKEIMSQLHQEVDVEGNVVMFLNEPTADAFPAESNAATSATEAASEEDAEMDDGEIPSDSATRIGRVLSAGTSVVVEEENTVSSKTDLDDSQIYDELNAQENADKETESLTKSEQSGVSGNANLDESKESLDNLEWAENLISAHDMEDEVAVKPPKILEEQAKKQEDISKKLKELTGDWSDDDDENDDDIGVAIAEEKTERTEEITDETKLDELMENAQTDVDMEIKTPNDDMDEDDIDLALKNLHKDDTSETTEQNEQKHDDDDEIMAAVEHEEESHEVANTSNNEELLEGEVLGELETTPELQDEFIKETSVDVGKKQKEVQISAEDKSTEKVTTPDIKEEHVVSVEESNDILLDDLMNDVTTVPVVAGLVSNVAAVGKLKHVAEPLVEEKLSTENVNTDDVKDLENVAVIGTNVKEIKTEVVVSDVTIAKANIEGSTSEKSSSGSTKSADNNKITVVPTEKVKILISDWVDEDDEEVEDVAADIEHVALPKEEDKKQN